jgi:hypothetical protein
MRLMALVFTAALLAPPAWAQQAQPSPKPETPSSTRDRKEPAEQEPKNQGSENQGPDLPVSLDKIKEALQHAPAEPLRGLDIKPTFKLQIHERPTISLDDLMRSLNFKAGPVPAGGVYGAEMQRQMWNPVDHPLRQPYAAFSQPELLTILVENLVGKYVAGKAIGAITDAERAHAEAAARAEARGAIDEYCAAQPNHGAGIRICSNPDR